MFKRTHIKLISLLIVLSLVLTSIPGSAMNANAVNAEAAESSTFQLDADCQILDYVHEEVFNGNDHIARLEEEETLDTYVFLNRDGTKTVYYMNDAVKYRDASGTIREKNIDLTTGINGYSTTQNDVQLHIPNNITNGVQLSYAGYDVSIVPQGGSSKLSPQRNGNSVAYPNYFGSGTALVYTPTLDGVKEDILLAKYSGTNEFTFLLNTDGLNLYHTPEDRYYLALTEDSEMQIWLGNIEIFDAEAKPSMGTLTVETVTAGQQYRLTVSADVEFLTDPDTVYPVTIDPTITVSDNNNGVNAIEDAPIFEGYPTSNFGTYQYDRAGYVGSPYGKGRTVVRLNGLVNDTNYKAASEYNISSVIFYIAEASGTAAQQVNLYPLTSNSTWTETNITWNNYGSTGSLYATNTISYNSYSSFNITALARLWKNGIFNSNCGFILIGANESSVDKSLYSSEHSTSSMRPYVVATYNEKVSSSYNSSPYINEEYSTSESTYLCRYDNALQFRANCYGYAFRFYYPGYLYNEKLIPPYDSPYRILDENGNITDSMYCYKQRPGEFAAKASGLPIYDANDNVITTISNYDELKNYYNDYVYSPFLGKEDRMFYLVRLLEADAETLGYTIEEHTSDSIPSASADNSRRLIAVVLNHDYHFYMQHSDNTWSHKRGEDEPSTVSIDSKIGLTNNNIRDLATEGSWYTGGELKFFYITKSSTIECSHNFGKADSSTGTSMCAANNAKAVGDDITSAMDLGTTLPIQFSGLFDFRGDTDYFSLRPNISKTATFSITGSDAAFSVKLYNGNGNQMVSYQSQSGNVSFTYSLSTNTRYYLSITTYTLFSDYPEQYTVNIS